MCDPRLNHQQSLELAFLVAEMLAQDLTPEPAGMPSAHLPPAPVADLLSDTLTKPTPACGLRWQKRSSGRRLRRDSGVRELEEQQRPPRARAGLFTPTGSLANQLALRLHVAPGEEMLADELAHVVRAELGAAAAFSGITSRTWPSDEAGSTRRLRSPLGDGSRPYQVCTSLVVVDAANFGGGTIQPLAAIRAVRAAARPVGVRMRLDGARLWNAWSTGIPLDDYGRELNSVSVCLSKGLGAPVDGPRGVE